jgi:hypothetical protein
MTDPQPEDSREVAIVWVGIDEIPVLTANQSVVQIAAQNEFIVAFGHFAPPVLLGTDEQKRQQLEMTTFVPVRPVGRVGMTRQRVEELRDLLSRMLTRHDEQFA